MLQEVTGLLNGLAVAGFFTDVLNTEDSNRMDRHRIIPVVVFQMTRKNKHE